MNGLRRLIVAVVTRRVGPLWVVVVIGTKVPWRIPDDPASERTTLSHTRWKKPHNVYPARAKCQGRMRQRMMLRKRHRGAEAPSSSASSSSADRPPSQSSVIPPRRPPIMTLADLNAF